MSPMEESAKHSSKLSLQEIVWIVLAILIPPLSFRRCNDSSEISGKQCSMRKVYPGDLLASHKPLEGV